MAKILYVDDEAANLVVFEAMSEGHFEALTAESGAQAIEILEREEVMVLLADQRMPGMTGVELAEYAREHYPDVVRLLITAYSDLSVAIDAINRGQIRGYLRKPWNQQEMLATLREALSSFELQKRANELELHMLATERVYTLGVVTAGVAHELQNPLSMLRHNSSFLQTQFERLKESLDGDDKGDSIATLEAMVPVLDSFQEAVDSMAEVCRGLEPGNRLHDEEDPTCDLGEAAQLATRIAVPTLRDRARLILQIESNPLARGCCSQLARVILNLLVNAYEAIDPSRRDGVVAVRVFESGESVVCEIRDNGTGMSPATERRIFQPFFTTKERGGTGLGLAISRTIVEESGGTLSCESEDGVGTTFRMSLAKAASQ